MLRPRIVEYYGKGKEKEKQLGVGGKYVTHVRLMYRRRGLPTVRGLMKVDEKGFVYAHMWLEYLERQRRLSKTRNRRSAKESPCDDVES